MSVVPVHSKTTTGIRRDQKCRKLKKSWWWCSDVRWREREKSGWWWRWCSLSRLLLLFLLSHIFESVLFERDFTAWFRLLFLLISLLVEFPSLVSFFARLVFLGLCFGLKSICRLSVLFYYSGLLWVDFFLLLLFLLQIWSCSLMFLSLPSLRLVLTAHSRPEKNETCVTENMRMYVYIVSCLWLKRQLFRLKEIQRILSSWWLVSLCSSSIDYSRHEKRGWFWEGISCSSHACVVLPHILSTFPGLHTWNYTACE